MYAGRNKMRFIAKGIGIYSKIPITPIIISPGSCSFQIEVEDEGKCVSVTAI